MGTTDLNYSLHDDGDSAREVGSVGFVQAGNLSDDDGTVIDSLVQEASEPATPEQQPKESIPAINKRREPSARMFATTLTLPAGGWDPVMIFPADANRKHLYITHTNGDNSSEPVGWFMGETSAAVSGPKPTAAFLLRPQPGALGAVICIDDYTGPVWIGTSALAAASTTLSFLSISKGVSDNA